MLKSEILKVAISYVEEQVKKVNNPEFTHCLNSILEIGQGSERGLLGIELHNFAYEKQKIAKNLIEELVDKYPFNKDHYQIERITISFLKLLYLAFHSYFSGGEKSTSTYCYRIVLEKISLITIGMIDTLMESKEDNLKLFILSCMGVRTALKVLLEIKDTGDDMKEEVSTFTTYQDILLEALHNVTNKELYKKSLLLINGDVALENVRSDNFFNDIEKDIYYHIYEVNELLKNKEHDRADRIS